MTAAPPITADVGSLRAAAEGHLQARRWAEAAACLKQVLSRDAATAMRLNLASNLAALQRHRPGVYDVLINTPAQGEYHVAATPLGKLSVAHRATGMLMCVTHDPPAAAAAQVERIAASLDNGQAVGLLGLGDGHLLAQLMQRPMGRDAGATSAVLVFEPSVDAVTACLMLHDYAGPGGPIEQTRVHWFVGPGWLDAYRRTALADLYLPSPQVCLSVGNAGKTIHTGVQAVTNELRAYDERLRGEVEAHYATVTRAQLLAAFAGAGDSQAQRPRVLITTSRFTTVLRYSAAGVADAFTALGWDARLSIEQHDWQLTSKLALRRHVADFKPHLVFVIDHLRAEFGDLYPLQLPFACWIQDDLATLTTPDAGAAITARDFILTGSASMYQTHYGYPPRQCIMATKLTRQTRVEDNAAEKEGHGPARHDLLFSSRVVLNAVPAPDIVYVSHAGAPLPVVLDRLRDAFTQIPQVVPLVEACAQRVIERYARGECIHSMGQMVALVEATERDADMRLQQAGLRDQIVRRLMHPLNNALYRQQTLRWVANAAAALGAKLELYGQGWEDHDEFAAFARGPVAYGPALADLTRRAAVSLHIVPYFYLHQRLLDGLVADGFFLIREHPSDTWRFRWRRFVDAHLPAAVATLADARAMLPPAPRAELEALLAESYDTCMIHGFDTLATYRALQSQGLAFIFEDMPQRDDVSFADPRTCEDLLRRYLAAPDARRAISRQQRAWVEQHYTYEAGMARTLDRIRTLIAEEETSR